MRCKMWAGTIERLLESMINTCRHFEIPIRPEYKAVTPKKEPLWRTMADSFSSFLMTRLELELLTSIFIPGSPSGFPNYSNLTIGSFISLWPSRLPRQEAIPPTDTSLLLEMCRVIWGHTNLWHSGKKTPIIYSAGGYRGHLFLGFKKKEKKETLHALK